MIEIKISCDDTGAVAITGPIENKVVVLGLLEVAKEAVLDHHRKAAARVVQLASPIFGSGPPRGI
jgi:hypothetical protein